MNESVSLTAGHMPGGGIYLQEVGQWRHPEPGFLYCTGKKCNKSQNLHCSCSRHLCISVTSLPIYKRNKLWIMQVSLMTVWASMSIWSQPDLYVINGWLFLAEFFFLLSSFIFLPWQAYYQIVMSWAYICCVVGCVCWAFIVNINFAEVIDHE